jgi:hypothetical protein
VILDNLWLLLHNYYLFLSVVVWTVDFGGLLLGFSLDMMSTLGQVPTILLDQYIVFALTNLRFFLDSYLFAILLSCCQFRGLFLNLWLLSYNLGFQDDCLFRNLRVILWGWFFRITLQFSNICKILAWDASCLCCAYWSFHPKEFYSRRKRFAIWCQFNALNFKLFPRFFNNPIFNLYWHLLGLFLDLNFFYT